MAGNRLEADYQNYNYKLIRAARTNFSWCSTTRHANEKWSSGQSIRYYSFITHLSPHDSLLVPRAPTASRVLRHVHSCTKMLNSSFRLIRRWTQLSGVRYRCADSGVTCTDSGITRTDTGIKEEATDQLLMRVAVIGLPNCGKSTLVNQLMKQKVKSQLYWCVCTWYRGIAVICSVT